MEIMRVPQGDFSLSRYPKRQRETLRAWDAGDELLLQHLDAEKLLHADSRVLVLNDSFGAISVALAHHHPQLLSDSHLAFCGTRANLKANGLSETLVTLTDSLQTPEGIFDLVLIKVPKTLALLEHQLFSLRPHIHGKTRVIGAGMVKAVHTSTLQLFENILGPTKTSLARKKARLIFCEPELSLEPGQSPYPREYALANFGHRIVNHANVFSREKLDIGTRFFLEHIPACNAKRIIDLGCGNGVVGLIAAERNPEAEVTFIDESFMAVASARENFTAAFGNARRGIFIANDCLSDIDNARYDLILNNPPFHQQNAVGDHIAWQMFRASREALRPNGTLWVIGNRHLGYHVKLKRIFGDCETVASNKKFVILKATKR